MIAMTVEFTDGHIEAIDEVPGSVADLVEVASARIEELIVAHGPPVSVTPSSGRFTMVSNTEAARLRDAGIATQHIAADSYREFLEKAGLEWPS